MPGSSPLSAPPTSSWNLLTDCTEFHPGAQKRGIRAGGGSPANPSMEKASGGIRVIGRLRFMDVHMGRHGRPPAITVRLPRNLLSRHPEIRPGKPRRGSDFQGRYGFDPWRLSHHPDSARTGASEILSGSHDILNPAPALPDIPAGIKDAVISLGPPFA